MPLHLCDQGCAHTVVGVRGDLREVLSDHFQAAGLQRDREEVLHPRHKKLIHLDVMGKLCKVELLDAYKVQQLQNDQ